MTTTDVFSAMQIGNPYKIYKKTVLGKVFIQIINQFDNKPEGVILQGIPTNNDDGCFIQLWNDKEDMFFRRMNKKHLIDGTLIPIELDVFTDKDKDKDIINYSEFTNEDIKEIVMSRFLALRAHLNKTDSEAHLYRILEMAETLGKSEKILTVIRARISEIQYGKDEE